MIKNHWIILLNSNIVPATNLSCCSCKENSLLREQENVCNCPLTDFSVGCSQNTAVTSIWPWNYYISKGFIGKKLLHKWHLSPETPKVFFSWIQSHLRTILQTQVLTVETFTKQGVEDLCSLWIVSDVLFPSCPTTWWSPLLPMCAHCPLLPANITADSSIYTITLPDGFMGQHVRHDSMASSLNLGKWWTNNVRARESSEAGQGFSFKLIQLSMVLELIDDNHSVEPCFLSNKSWIF